jgi:heptosyltransferase-2
MAEIHCRYFDGYKPCGKGGVCERSQCRDYRSVQERILVVHLEALGAVLRSTSLLTAIKRKYPRSHITWVTKAPAQALLENLPTIDRVLTSNPEDIIKLSVLRFDLAFVLDKSLLASGVVKICQVREVRGFRALSSGAIVPANPEAKELWELGLSDHRKFFVNQKSEQRLCHEALDLGEYERDEYQIQLRDEERALAAARRRLWSPKGRPLIALNTGCSPNLPAKKLSVDGHRQLIRLIRGDSRFEGCPIVLLGGPEDTERNAAIARDLPVIQSPTTGGLRDGLASVEACDVLFTGDSLGMHMAIGLRKWVVAWFGPTCPQEIDLYGRGHKIRTLASCSPCWKKACRMERMCYDQVNFALGLQALAEGLEWHISSSKPHSREISFSPSP